MTISNKSTVKKAKESKEKEREKTLPTGHKRLVILFQDAFRPRRVFKYARYELQTDGVTTVLRVFELSTNREFMFPFGDVKEVRA